MIDRGRTVMTELQTREDYIRFVEVLLCGLPGPGQISLAFAGKFDLNYCALCTMLISKRRGWRLTSPSKGG